MGSACGLCMSRLLCVGPVWGVSVGWSVKVLPEVVLVARSGGLSERVFAVRSAVASQVVGVRRASDSVCMFGILVPVGILE